MRMGRNGATEWSPRALLVIANQADAIPVVLERSHPIVCAWRRQPVGHQITGPTKTDVGETLGKVQQGQARRLIISGKERPVPDAGWPLLGLCSLDECGKRNGGGGADSGALQKRTTIHESSYLRHMGVRPRRPESGKPVCLGFDGAATNWYRRDRVSQQ